MTTATILSQRLRNQKLSSPTLQRPVDVVRWMGAVQAQDFNGAKWALALRIRGATDKAIEEAYNNGQILRTHLLRPTWHFVAPEDIRWLLQLTAPRVNLRCGPNYRKYELDAAGFKRSNRALSNALKGGKHLTRSELKAVLNRSGVAADDNVRLAHILLRAELDGVVCSGPRRGKQFTYALLDERVRATKPLTGDEALAELTRRYFSSHGPASLQDFVWWSSLTTNDARRGIELIDRDLRTDVVEEKVYYNLSSKARAPHSPHLSHLLPAYDEYNVAYKDRQLVNDGIAAWDALGPTVLVDGKIVGTWSGVVHKNILTISVKPARALKKPEKLAIAQATERHAAFLGLCNEAMTIYN
jgi:hypothetical protein